MSAAATINPSSTRGEEQRLSKDKIELLERPSDLGEFCDDFSGLAFNLRPHNLDGSDSSQSPSGLNINEEDDGEESDAEMSPRSEALRNLSEKVMVPNFQNPLSLANLNFMDPAGAVDFLQEQLISSRKRFEDVPEFLSEPPPNKRAKHSGERRRGRPRKEEISENEDLKTVAKRMYARAYRENMKSKFVEVEQQLNDLRKEHAILKAGHKKLESLVEQCNFCSSSWALVKNMNIDPVVLRMAYDTLSNIKSPSGSPRSSSKSPGSDDEDEHSASAE